MMGWGERLAAGVCIAISALSFVSLLDTTFILLVLWLGMITVISSWTRAR